MTFHGVDAKACCKDHACLHGADPQSYGGWRKPCTTPILTNTTMNHTNTAPPVYHWGYHKFCARFRSVICPNWPFALSLPIFKRGCVLRFSRTLKWCMISSTNSTRCYFSGGNNSTRCCAVYSVQGATGSTLSESQRRIPYTVSGV